MCLCMQVSRNDYRCTARDVCHEAACQRLLDDVISKGTPARQELASQIEAEAAEIAAKLAAERLQLARLCVPYMISRHACYACIR